MPDATSGCDKESREIKKTKGFGAARKPFAPTNATIYTGGVSASSPADVGHGNITAFDSSPKFTRISLESHTMAQQFKDDFSTLGHFHTGSWSKMFHSENARRPNVFLPSRPLRGDVFGAIRPHF